VISRRAAVAATASAARPSIQISSEALVLRHQSQSKRIIKHPTGKMRTEGNGLPCEGVICNWEQAGKCEFACRGGKENARDRESTGNLHAIDNHVAASAYPADMLGRRAHWSGIKSMGSHLWRLATIFLLLSVAHAAAAPARTSVAEIENGFRLMYNLKFTEAEREFSNFQQQHSDNPMGPISDATDLLFSEFQRLGILETQFYEDDAVFAARKQLTADPGVRDRFNGRLSRAEELAHARLLKDPTDHDALFALTLASGLKADYLALIEKRNFASLHYAKQASVLGNQLLAVHPDCYDAHLASGISRYLTGSLAAPLRWIVRLGGANPDKQGGIAELKLTAERGELLAPFARILLALAYVRDKDKKKATAELEILRTHFPDNPLFSREIARLRNTH
jgi:hypothetical protein